MNQAFYNSKKWKDKRQYILRRDHYLCQECKKYGRNVEAKIVHHIKEVEDYPELKLVNSNLVSVCKACHNKVHPEKGGHYIKR
jgi:5-methylcytosine-specific restriction protein A